MVDINVSNFITVGVISLVVIAGLRAALKMASVDQDFI